MNTKRSWSVRPWRVMVGALLVVCTAAPAQAAVQYRWVQLVAGETLNDILQPRVRVRAIVDRGETCPTLFDVGGQPVAVMLERWRDPTLKGFDEIKVCQATFDAFHPLLRRFTPLFFDSAARHEAGLLPDLTDGVPLASLVAFGCTGCRDDVDQPQCDLDGPGWLFHRINTDAAARTRNGIPPVVAYLGDMRYAGQETVDDSWTSDTTLGWREEVFEPTKELMARSWWVVLRGNHEGCFVPGNDWNKKTSWRDRGSAWLYFFGDGDLTCGQVADSMHDVLPPWAMDATIYGGGVGEPVASDEKVRLVFLDTVRTGDGRDKDKSGTRKRYKQNFDHVADRLVQPLPDDRPVWLLGHIPPYAMKKSFEPTAVLAALSDSGMEKHLSRMSLSVSAHIHRFALVRPGAGNANAVGPTQFVVGNGGVALSGTAGDELHCKRDDVKWKLAGGEEREEKWVGARTSNHGYMLARFSVDAANQVSAAYRVPLLDLHSAAPDPSREVICTGDGDRWSRILCPTFETTDAGSLACAE